VARSIPWVCSDAKTVAGWHQRRRGRIGLRGLTAAAICAAIGLAIPTAGLPSRANPLWRQGVFPVVSFAGFTSHFGHRLGPAGALEPHHGLDIAAPLGSPIRNWWAGTVLEVRNDGACGLGLLIGSGAYEHLYCHLSGSVNDGVYRSGPVQLTAGSRVRGGQLIGHVGLSGRTTGPHLHWGLRYRGRWLDPGTVLRAMALARGR
jgi:murein DD-endopeptidase MepM/ murein hydrolase activator NlpD